MAAQARAVFERDFAGEVMIQNAVEYYHNWCAARAARVSPYADTEIDVVVRVGGRPAETVLRALRSLDAQKVGRYRVILVMYKLIDLSFIIEEDWVRIKHFERVECIGGIRSQTLCVGLKSVRADLFAVLDDDDFFLDNHFESLLDAIRTVDRDKAFAYSGLIEFDDAPGMLAAEEEHRQVEQASLRLGHGR